VVGSVRGLLKVHAGIGALGVALVAIALVPVTGASVFHLDEPLPTQNLVMAVLTWVGFTLALSAGLLLSSTRRAG
jgi:hypothetical protein